MQHLSARQSVALGCHHYHRRKKKKKKIIFVTFSSCCDPKLGHSGKERKGKQHYPNRKRPRASPAGSQHRNCWNSFETHFNCRQARLAVWFIVYNNVQLKVRGFLVVTLLKLQNQVKITKIFTYG